MQRSLLVGYAIKAGKGFVSEAKGTSYKFDNGDSFASPIKMSWDNIQLFNGLFGIDQAKKIADFYGAKVVPIYAGVEGTEKEEYGKEENQDGYER